MTKLRLIFAMRSCAPIRLEPDVALVMRVLEGWIIVEIVEKIIETEILHWDLANYSYQNLRSLDPE